MTSQAARPRPRGLTAATMIAIVVLAGACTQATPSLTPSPSPSSTATATPSSAPPSPASATPVITASPTASPTPLETPCPVTKQTGNLPSDRLLNVVAASSGGFDTLTFVFGNPSLPGPAGTPTGELTLAEPPYTFGPSGLPITMVGERVLQLVFRHLSLSADTGEPVYTGPAELKPDLAVLKHAVEFDESEGQIGWYVGYDGPHCATLSTIGTSLVLSFPSP